MSQAKMAIFVSQRGIENLSFIGITEDERRIGFKLFVTIEQELKLIDKAIKKTFEQESHDEDFSK